jgi:hypothetical protein
MGLRRVTGLADIVRSVSEDARRSLAATSARQRYAVDPFALLGDGYVSILGFDGRPDVFIPYDHQLDTLAAWVDMDHLATTGQLRFRNLHVEKSRQMGETWILAYGCLWAIVFHSARGLVLHQEWAKVDDGGDQNTPESFFGKIRYLNTNTDWDAAGMQPPRLRFTSNHGAGGASVRNLARPESYIVGSGQNDDPGRGSTLAFAIVDEAAHVHHTERVHESLSRACPSGKVYNSTPHGQSNAFYRIRRDRPANWTFRRYHWSQHPIYGAGQRIVDGKLTSPWYDRETQDMTDEQIARQLDIDYAGSLEARVYKEWNPAIHAVDRRLFDPNLPVELGWDFGINHPTSIVVCQDAGESYNVVAEFETSDATPDQISNALLEILGRLKIAHPLTREWTRQILSVGDVAGNARSANTGTSLWNDYGVHGWTITGRWSTIDRTVVAVKRILRGVPKPLRVSIVDAPRFVEHIQNNTWPTDSEGKRRAGATAPNDDEHNHQMRAFAYLVTHKFPPPEDDQAMPEPPFELFDGVLMPGVAPGMAF